MTFKFRRDFEKGKKYEYLATEYFDYKEIKFSRGKCKEYDFIVDGVKVEVKSDIIASRTGNLAIEYKCRGKRSGIKTTEAEFYMYFINHDLFDEVYKIPVKKLKKLCKKYGRKTGGGDDNASKMYLLDKDYLKEYIITEKLHAPYKLTEEDIKEKMSFSFGKHKGRTFEEVAERDIQYLKWILQQEYLTKNTKEDIRKILRPYA
jgi:hypothetical protein